MACIPKHWQESLHSQLISPFRAGKLRQALDDACVTRRLHAPSHLSTSGKCKVCIPEQDTCMPVSQQLLNKPTLFFTLHAPAALSSPRTACSHCHLISCKPTANAGCDGALHVCQPLQPLASPSGDGNLRLPELAAASLPSNSKHGCRARSQSSWARMQRPQNKLQYLSVDWCVSSSLLAALAFRGGCATQLQQQMCQSTSACITYGGSATDNQWMTNTTRQQCHHHLIYSSDLGPHADEGPSHSQL